MNAEQKLEAGLSVSIPEIIETFCELKTTVRGKVPTDESVELVRRKVAEADLRGLLEDPNLSGQLS